MGQYRRFIIGFVEDARNIPKKDYMAIRRIQEQGVGFAVYDIDINEAEKRKYGVSQAPEFLVLERPRGFNDGMFKTAYVVKRFYSLKTLEAWMPWIKQAKHNGHSGFPRM